MKVNELLLLASNKINEYDAKLLLSTLLNISILELGLMGDKFLNEDIVHSFLDKANSIMNGKPIQYVIGNVNFYGNIFKINEKVLIPRFETEELVENTFELINKYFSDPVDIIDLGCGSGAIGLSLKKKIANANVTLLDISPDALDVAKENAYNLNCEVTFVESDMWNKVTGKYDVIISNPPYIRNDEKIEDVVFNNEPHIALFGGEDGLDCYRKIRGGLLNHIKDRFLVAMEIGDVQKDTVVKMFSDIENVKIITKCDMQGRDRMVFVLRI